jgi:hypothetical protein
MLTSDHASTAGTKTHALNSVRTRMYRNSCKVDLLGFLVCWNEGAGLSQCLGVDALGFQAELSDRFFDVHRLASV